MCGRYYRRSDKQRIAEAFKVGDLPIDFVLPEWDYNVAPTTFQPVSGPIRKPVIVNLSSCAGALFLFSPSSFQT